VETGRVRAHSAIGLSKRKESAISARNTGRKMRMCFRKTASFMVFSEPDLENSLKKKI
jgi:hypothetical protein